MAKKTATKKLHDNGLEVFCVHSNDASSKSTFSTLKKERGSSPRFAYAAGVTAESLDPETVARAYLKQPIDRDSVPSFTAPVVNKVASEFKSLGAEAIPLTDTTTVKFRQILNKVPIYGSLVTVELDDKNELLGINSSTGTPTGVSPIAKISRECGGQGHRGRSRVQGGRDECRSAALVFLRSGQIKMASCLYFRASASSSW